MSAPPVGEKVGFVGGESTMESPLKRRRRGATSLIEVHGPNRGRRIDLPGRPVTVGRVEGNDIVLGHQSSSRRHAIILPDPDGGFLVKDLGSTNGVHLDDAQITEAPLFHGALLRVGACIFKVLCGDELEPQIEGELERLRHLDGLTMALSREAFMERVQGTLDAPDGPACLLLLEVTDFQQLRQRFGPLAADNVLSLVAGVLRRKVRDQDQVGRLDDARFGLLLSRCHLEDARLKAAWLCRHLALSSFQYQDQIVPIYLGAGLAVFGEGHTADTLVAAAASDLGDHLSLA